jgi:hypothetical protein
MNVSSLSLVRQIHLLLNATAHFHHPLTGVVIQMASVSAWEQFMMGRFISGLGIGALSAAVPMVYFSPNVSLPLLPDRR